MPILHFQRRREKNFNLQRMGPPQFKERVPHPHSLKLEKGMEGTASNPAVPA